jgi:hypothetical protein
MEDGTRRQFLAITLASPVAGSLLAASHADLREQFAKVPGESRLRMHWFVFGPAWTTAEAKRQLSEMAKAGIGGVLLFPAYPVAVDDEARGVRNQRYLSPEFLTTLREVAGIVKELGLTLDVVAGTGWPYGGPSVSERDSARMLRMTRIRLLGGASPAGPELRGTDKRIALFIQRGATYELLSSPPTRGMAGDALIVFDDVPTRMGVKRAALGADGLIVDHLNSEAILRYMDAVGKPLVEASLPALRSIFCDSLEVYRANWTGKLPEFFRERRGYDLIPHLAAMFDDGHPDVRDIRCDFWRTQAELIEQEFLRTVQSWTRDHNTTFQAEAYGTPPVALSGYRYVDLPVGEHYEWKMFNTSRYASSGAHLSGRREVWAEAWTWAGIPNRFGDSLENLKLASDMHFVSGINGLIGISYSYSPMELGAPGWMPYFGPVVNHASPFWRYMPGFVDYVSRTSHLLQQGKPVADVGLYLPSEDALADAPPTQVMLNWTARDRLSTTGVPSEFGLRNALRYEAAVVKTIITNGYQFDGIDTFALNSAAKISQGRLLIGDGDYGCVVLPNLNSIDPESLELLERFVESGGLLVATRRVPNRAFGMLRRNERQRRVRDVVRRLFGERPSLRERQVGRGKVIFAPDEEASLLSALRFIPPDIEFSRADENVSFAHRRTDSADIYFVSNLGLQPVQLRARFRGGRRLPALWDPMTGMVHRVHVREQTPVGARIDLHLDPLQSMFVVLEDDVKSFPTVPQILDENLMSGGDLLPAPIRIDTRWQLTFEDTAAPAAMLSELLSWTELPGARYFSGKATYESQPTVPAAAMKQNRRVCLDLGAVRETAEVWVNDKPAGVRWMRPYRFDVTTLLHPGRNSLRVDVTNLLINRVLGAGPPDYSAVTAKFGERFPPGNEWTAVREPFPSGLLGPVRLVFAVQHA